MKKKQAAVLGLSGSVVATVILDIVSLPALFLYLARHSDFQDHFFPVMCSIYGLLAVGSLVNAVLAFRWLNPWLAAIVTLGLGLCVAFPPYAYYNYASSYYEWK